MKQPVFQLLVLTFLVFTNAKWTSNDDDNDLNLHWFEQTLARRYFLNEYQSFTQREASISIEDRQKFQNDSLNTHNLLRATHCVPPLVLDDEINARAEAYAEYLARNDSGLIHSTDRRGLFGENLYSVTRTRPITNPDGDKVTRTWYGEVALYNYTKPGYAINIAHFSQIVWNNTKILGVGYAFAREGRKMYVVAQYGPPGNYGYAFSTNVLEPKC